MNNRFRPRTLPSILIAGVLFLTLLTACLSPSGGGTKPVPRQHEWAEALRALDPADANTPANDITAVYLREGGDVLQIRIDLLDFKNPKDISMEIRIDGNSTPQPSPLVIQIPSKSDSPRISLDPLLATVIVDVPLSELPSRPRVDISTPEDKITGLTLDGAVPAQTAPLLLTFYDTFAGRFPAEALRSWDGAHTGPRGERHGLKHLLDAVEEYQIPVVLLDLKEPENLSALDAMGVLHKIKALENNSLLIITGIKQRLLLSSSLENNQETDSYQFAYLQDATHLYHPLFSKITYIPIVVETDTTQPTSNGPSIEIRRTLLETALNNDKKDLLVLGGNFQETTWGSPDMVGITMEYFASRPYVQILGAEDLVEFPATSNNAIIPQPEEPIDELASQIQSALEFANSWAEDLIETKKQCRVGLFECILADENYLAIFDAQGARLTYLFAVGRDDIPPYTQLIGPSWQVAPGIDGYSSAFADDKVYEPIIVENSLIFTSMDSTRVKTFTLSETGLEVKYQTQEPVITQIPLLVEPDTRFTPGWATKYIQQNTPNGIAWGLENGPMVSIQTEGAITMRAFNELLDLLAIPEDPDFEYPPGHYVPFPMAIVEVEMLDGYFLRLERLP